MGRFDSLIKAKACQSYWNNNAAKTALQRTKQRAAVHMANIEYNVYEEHDAISGVITSRLVSANEGVSVDERVNEQHDKDQTGSDFGDDLHNMTEFVENY
ncbi:6179_t:CDS:2 [Paraglomus occultum]|uniref:6179_t:CDS:1 n=1 Tax=Paraglomus occultum TaxID=144539 RepID=A0A9N8WHH4_9GLOM|nr:6179_t:CDS:2 [Paraglomus occultum]